VARLAGWHVNLPFVSRNYRRAVVSDAAAGGQIILDKATFDTVSGRTIRPVEVPLSDCDGFGEANSGMQGKSDAVGRAP
jgi:hypothetical protein